MTDHQNLLSATNGVLLPSYIWYRSSVPENSTNGSSAFGATTTTTTTTTGLEHMDSDELLVKEWNQLSLTEREHVEEEVHGVAIYQKEDNEAFVKESLEHLEDELHKLRKRRPSYDKAVFLNPSYVKSRDFRLLFLRSEYFDTKKAAERLVGHFDLKLQLFGLDKLSRDIKLEDLPEEAVAALNCGAIQILPGKDRTGRSIICVANKYQNYNSCSLAELQMAFYQCMVALEDVESQKKGLVLLAYNVDAGGLSKMDPMGIPSGVKFMAAIPMRITAVHFCYNDPATSPFLTLTKYVIGRESRLRFRTHYGSHLECQYALMTFGITQSLLPFNEQGVMDWRNFRNALEKRRVLEDERKLVCGNAIFCPLEFDVLLGRGRPFQEYTGNKRLAVIIDTRRQEYAASKRGGKTIVCDKIVELIQKSGGRFLKRQDENVHDGVWVEVDNSVARDKVSHGFRTKTRRNSLLSASVACKEGRATPDNGDMEASSLTF